MNEKFPSSEFHEGLSKTEQAQCFLNGAIDALKHDNLNSSLKLITHALMLVVQETKCTHSHWTNEKHGRFCTCGVQMWDAGD